MGRGQTAAIRAKGEGDKIAPVDVAEKQLLARADIPNSAATPRVRFPGHEVEVIVRSGVRQAVTVAAKPKASFFKACTIVRCREEHLPRRIPDFNLCLSVRPIPGSGKP